MEKNKITMTARVSEVQRDRYILICEKGEVQAKMKGSLYKEEQTPVVGDYVDITYNLMGESRIDRIYDRKSILKRPDRSGHAAGYVKTMKEQVMIANYDYAFIVASLNQNFNLNRIARYISTVLQGGGRPVVILSKADLCENVEEYKNKVKEISEAAEVVAICALNGYGMNELQNYLKKGTTIALIGSSGVGKSTMLNTIAGTEIMKVSAIREEDGKGRHTTTHRHLFMLENDITIIDTPGMRELGVCDVEEGIDQTFSDIAQLIEQCKFHDCHHEKEPGCAIKRALESGELSTKRWDLYCKLQGENRWAKQKLKKGRFY